MVRFQPFNVRLFLGFVVSFCAVLPLTSNAQCTTQGAATSYQLPNGSCWSITGANGVCRDVDNQAPNGLDLFIPNNSGAEWASFYGGTAPSGVTISSCCGVTPNPTTYNTAGAKTPISIPSGCSSVVIHAWGAGGGGAGQPGYVYLIFN